MSFQEKFREILTQNNMKPAELARAAGISDAIVSMYLSGRKEPNARTCRVLCKVLGVSLDELLETGFSAAPLSAAAYRIGKLYSYAGPRDRRLVETVLEPYLERFSSAVQHPATQEETAAELALHPAVPQSHTVPLPAPLPLYLQPAAAGLGNYLDDGDFETVSFPHAPAHANIAVKVSGNSMEPVYHDGDIVFVETESVLGEREIGIFCYEGECYIKKLMLNPPRLTSLNRDYPDLPIHEEAAFHTIGRVLGVASTQEEE